MSDKITNPCDLTLASVEELLTELSSRSEVLIIGGEMLGRKTHDSTFLFFKKGTVSGVLGLGSIMTTQIQNLWDNTMRNSQPIDPPWRENEADSEDDDWDSERGSRPPFPPL